MPIKAAPPTDPDVKIVLPRCERRPLTVVLEGVTPLLTDRIPDWVVEDIQRKQAGQTPIVRPKRNAQDVFNEARYVIDAEEQRFGLPTTAVMKSMARAAQRYSKRTLVEMYGVISVPHGLFEIEAPAPELSMMSGRNKSRQIIPVIRPLFMPWRITVDLHYMFPFVTDEEVVSLLSMAGELVGVGAFRKECGGPYGRFVVGEVK